MKSYRTFFMAAAASAVFVLLVIIAAIFKPAKASAGESNMSELGAMWAAYAQGDHLSSDGETYYAIGKTINIPMDEMDRAVEYYQIGGRSNAVALADQYVKERNALYAAALANGCTATEDEIRQYLDELRDMLYRSENKEDIFAVIQGFGSEDEYWAYEYTVYQKEYPIIKYTEALRDNYLDNMNGSYSEEGWQTYFAEVKNALVQDQVFVINAEYTE